MQKRALTPDQVRQRMRQSGTTLTAWAKERGYDRDAVYRVLNGKDKAHFGRAHEIAVALGLKIPVELQEYDNTASGAGNPQRKAAA